MNKTDLAPHHDVHTETPIQKEQRINREVNAFIDAEIARLQKEIDYLRGELVKLAKGGV